MKDQNVVSKLVDRGFSGADIHFFLQSFGIGIWIPQPYHPPLLLVHGDTNIEEEKEKINKAKEKHYLDQLKVVTDKWEQASIAADFEKHK